MKWNIKLLPVRVGDSRTLNIILNTGMAFDGLLMTAHQNLTMAKKDQIQKLLTFFIIRLYTGK